MHKHVFFHDKIYDSAGVLAPAISGSRLYGSGIFTTVAISDGLPRFWDKHWARIEDNAARTGLDISEFTEGSVRDALTEVIERNDALSGLARLTFFDESAGGLWPFETGRKSSLLITTRPGREVPGNFKLALSPYRVNSTSPLAGVKSCNYLEHILAIEEARGRGFDEAVRLNERGEITSGCMSNIFWEKDGRLFTPTLESGCLAGTTRGDILENSGAVEMDAGIEALGDADAIFLTSAGLGKARVAEFEGRSF